MTLKYKKSELLKLCKKNNIKGVSKKRKHEIISLLENYNIFKIKDSILKKKTNFSNPEKKEWKDIEKISLDKKDPISLEPFEDWTEEELDSGVFMNGFYYKEETIQKYFEMNQGKNKFYDPINPVLEIPKEIIDKYKIIREEILKEDDIQFEYETRYIQFDYHVFLMTFIFLRLPEIKNYKIETKIKKVGNRYCIGIVPNNISICSIHDYPYEIKALDTSSTTEALLIRISELYKKKKLIRIENNTIIIQKILSLPTRAISWFTPQRGYYFLDTSPKENNKKTIYNSLLDELDSF